MAQEASGPDAERARALILLLATLETVSSRLDDERPEDVGLLVRIGELEDFVRADLEQLRAERNPVS